jgi:dGTPase
MNWLQLLSHKRPGEAEVAAHDQTRSRFEQDYDRIIFSHPFRKLQDKTQVFPLPEDDFVHTRLTHSLEVSSVGRSLGKNAGSFLLEKYTDLQGKGYSIGDIGAIVGAACLAHDLGNPPFGHSGEDSISSFFLTNEKGIFFKQKLSKNEWNDLITFEGNAQGFRILNGKANGGLKLTFATLGAFTKYPLSSSCEKEEGRKSQKKFGYYQCNANLFQEMANEMGLINLGGEKWCRHPLAFLVEAADDICYHIIDLEDGCRLGLVSFEKVKNLLAQIIGKSFSDEKLDKIPSLNEKLGTLRAMAISQLIYECSEAFKEHESEMLKGKFDKALTSLIPSSNALNEIIEISIDKIYRSKQVLEKEAGGYEVIDNLIESLATSVYFAHFEKPLPKHESILRLLPEEFTVQLADSISVYDALQIVIDFVSGLTDSHAVRLYKTLKGYQLPV